ncbi:MAG: SDR family NAD(P)-dependent oxidoreductase, partial [Acidimicrobiales bacterium]
RDPGPSGGDGRDPGRFMIDADGRVVMISGPVRGIGRSIAERLRVAGYRLSLGGRKLEELEAMVAGWSDVDRDKTVSVHRFDAEDSDSARAWVDETVAHHGGIDVLVNNAGILEGFGLDDYDEAAFDAMWRINVKSPTLLTHLTLPHLRRSGHGRVINIASMSGKRVKGGFSPGYAMTKHAVMALTHATRQHGWADGIRATAICPAFVGTDMLADVDTGDEPIIDPDDIAELINTALMLPNHSSVPEIAINCRLEDLF